MIFPMNESMVVSYMHECPFYQEYFIVERELKMTPTTQYWVERKKRVDECGWRRRVNTAAHECVGLGLPGCPMRDGCVVQMWDGQREMKGVR